MRKAAFTEDMVLDCENFSKLERGIYPWRSLNPLNSLRYLSPPERSPDAKDMRDRQKFGSIRVESGDLVRSGFRF